MQLPFRYILRNLLTRKLTTALTAGGMALVVFVFATVLMLEAGLKQTMVATGSPDNVSIIRQSAQTEVQSTIDRSQAGIVESSSHVAYLPDGSKALAREVVVLVALPKKAGNIPANVAIRGSDSIGLAIRPQIRLRAGRLFRPGSSEIVVGNSITERFAGAELGQSLHFGQRDWHIVGIIDAGHTGFNSEIWGDREQMMQAFRRSVYSAITFRLADSSHFGQFRHEVAGDQRLTLETKRETQFYADQSEMMAKFIKYLGLALSVIFSLATGALLMVFCQRRYGFVTAIAAPVLVGTMFSAALRPSRGSFFGASCKAWLAV